MNEKQKRSHTDSQTGEAGSYEPSSSISIPGMLLEQLLEPCPVKEHDEGPNELF